MKDCLLCKSLGTENKTKIKSYDYWTLLINFKQPTLGSSLLVLNRHIETLSNLRQKELREYLRAVREYESAIKKSFRTERINHFMLGNLEPHVHYHMLPRYSHPKNFEGLVLEDSAYPKLPILDTEIREQKTLQKIIEKISENL